MSERSFVPVESDGGVFMRQLTAFLPVSAALFAFWVLLSGKFDAAHLGAGGVSALLVGFAAARLWALPPVIGAGRHPFGDVRWLRAMWYGPWLLGGIVHSSSQVAYLVLHPRMPIDPRLIRLRPRLPHTLARLTLANSITLTPGTVTLDVTGDEFLVHALTPASARNLEQGIVQRRVAGLFGPAAPAPEGRR